MTDPRRPAPFRLGTLQVTERINYFTIVPPQAELRILQVTDMHVADRFYNIRSDFASVRRMCDLFIVDFVVNTGDFFCHNPMLIVKYICGRLDSVVGAKYPWTFAWGNHDCDNFGKGNLAKADKIEVYFQHLPHCLYFQNRGFIEKQDGPGPADDPREKEAFLLPNKSTKPRDPFDGFYGGNFAIEVANPVTGEPAADMFILNSRRWHHVPPKAFAWVERHAGRFDGLDRALPALCFYHVPNVDYQQLWDAGEARGIKRENVCFEKDDGRMHEFFHHLGCVQACFVGHDHVNDYWGERDGIRYVYGRKTGMGAYGSMKHDPGDGVKGIKIGATLITINLEPGNFSFDHVSVFDDGTTWRP